MPWKVIFFRSGRGNQVKEFINRLDGPTKIKTLRSIDLLAHYGHETSMPHIKKVAPDLYELRVQGFKQVRILFTFRDMDIILLHGFVKKTFKIPIKELRTAIRRRRRFLE